MDVRTNSIFAVGGREALDVVEAVVARLDQSDIRQRRTEIYAMRNKPAIDIANAVNAFLQSQRDLQQIDPDLVSPFEQIEREVIVVGEPQTNSLIISATPRYYDEIMKMIEALDRAAEQVTVQALIVEVELNNTDEFGVELGFQDDLLFDRSVTSEIVFGPTVTNTAPNGVQTTTQSILSQESAPGFNFNQPATLLGNNAGGGFSSPATVGKQALSNFQMGRINGDLGFGGLVLSAGSESVNILLRALAENRKVEVLSRPLIQSLHNQPGTILVGQQFQQVTGASAPNATGFSTPQFALTDVGIQLNVTPNISPEGTIVMEVLATKSRLSPTESVFLFQNQNGTTVNSPVIDTSTAQATVSLRDGQTIVLGGMITKTEGSTTRKVPWLADLPLLGSVFRYDSKTSRRTELLIFLTPRIMRTPEDYEEQKQIEAERMSFMAEEAEKLHGPLFALPKPKIEIKPKSEPEPQGKADKAKKPGESSADAAAKKGSKKGSSKKKNKKGSKKKNKQGSKKRGSKKTDGAEPQAASTTIDGSDSDAALFALPGEVEGIESGVPVEVPPPADRRIKRFFGSLIP
ncbi:MAG: secretin N-terminal domain-containing protein [Planctomycetaceae bacterium]